MLICNALTLIDDGFIKDAAVRIENGRIIEIGEALAQQCGEQTIDAAGGYLVPGFIDIHIHGYGGKDTMNGKQHIKSMAAGLVKHGVTGFLPTTMAAAYTDTREALRGAAELMYETHDGANVLGCHLEGPFLNVSKKGAQPEQFIFPPSMENYLKIADGLEHAVKLMTIAPEIDGAMELISQLSKKTQLSAGHTNASSDEIAASASAGISQVTHLFNAMNPLSHRAPGVAGAALVDPRIGTQIIADLLHLHKNILRLAWLAKGKERCYLITDAMEATGMPDGQYMLGANHVTVINGKARLSDGTIAGSTLTMDRAIKNMVEVVGTPLEQAVYMASTAPANSIGETERGRIAPLAHADLAILNRDLGVDMTIVGGNIRYKK